MQNFSYEKGFYWLGKNRHTGNFHIKGFALSLVLKQKGCMGNSGMAYSVTVVVTVVAYETF